MGLGTTPTGYWDVMVRQTDARCDGGIFLQRKIMALRFKNWAKAVGSVGRASSYGKGQFTPKGGENGFLLEFAPNLVPKFLRAGSTVRDSTAIMLHILWDYGWLRSKKEGRGVDASGDPIPWFTYPAIDFIKQLDLRDLTVFEYGSGFSTLFWAKRSSKIISVETDKNWFEEIQSLAPENVELLLTSPDLECYVPKITEHGSFDIIVIDGTGESRLPCCQLAPKHLKPSGFIVLDNSDLWLEAAATLRNSGLIQADFTGLAPLHCHWHTTSLFFSRQYAIQPLADHQPHKSVAQPAKPWPDV
jgi:hypothetical protein